MDERIDRYLNVCRWAFDRYSANGEVVMTIGGVKQSFLQIENAAWQRFMA